MSKNSQVNVEQETAIANYKIVEVFYNLIQTSDAISAKDVRRELRKLNISPLLISKALPKLFKSFLANGNLVKTTEYELSDYNHKPLPKYKTVKRDESM